MSKLVKYYLTKLNNFAQEVIDTFVSGGRASKLSKLPK
jgi:hypothetical protein